MTTATYSTLEVFAAACAAQRLNGEYLKFPKVTYYDSNGQVVTYMTHNSVRCESKPANKILMRDLLAVRKSEVIQEDRNQAQAVMSHFQKFMFQQIAGTLGNFLTTAVRVSTVTEFPKNAFLDMAVVASLPNVYLRAQAKQQEIDRRELLGATSQHVGQPGDWIQGQFEVVSSATTKNLSRVVYAVSSGNLFFFFWNGGELTVGQKLDLRGQVKFHRDGNVTQLSRIRQTS